MGAETVEKLAKATLDGDDPPSLEQIMTYLVSLRAFYIDQRKKGKDHNTIVKSIGEDIWGSGCLYYEANSLAY